MAQFELAVQKVLAIETDKYTDRPSDNGGPTKYGISQKAFPNEDIKALTEARARELYKQHYWNDLYNDIPSQLLADELFDVVVNRGVVPGVKLLQETLIALGSRLKVDGVFGAATLTEVCRYKPDQILNRFYQRQCIGYVRIVKKDPTQLDNLEGWINRVFL